MLDKQVYPDAAPGDDIGPRPKCFTEACEMPPTGEGTGSFACEHEHVTTQGEFCGACWTVRETARWTWHCSRCYGRKPEGGREKWGHLCPMTLVLPGERMAG